MPEYIQPQYQTYTPSGVVDSLDGNTAKPGAMTALANLMPSPETVGLWIPRPAAYALTAFTGFSSPGYVSCAKQIGNLIVGMVATARNAGKDEPFVYNLSTGAFITVAGVTGANTPTSPATSGAWTPPTIDAVGGFIIFTHPGFSGGNFFGAITISGSTYTWSAGNTSGNALPSVPIAVTVFGDRAYYSCGNVLYFSDVLSPLVITNATNTLTLGGNDPIVATTGQPFFTTQTGGIIASLLALKATQIWQVTGDLATNNLVFNKLSDGVGTSCPRSVANTPIGTMFNANDGIRSVDLNGQVSEANEDLSIPFQNQIVPSRVAAAYNTGFYRICTNYLKGGTLQTVEFWFDTSHKRWCGPHSLTYDNILSSGSGFIVSGAGYAGQFMQSNVLPNEQTDFFTELGANLTFNYQTVTVPEFRAMPGWSLQESSVFLKNDQAQNLTANVLDQTGTVIAAVTLATPFLAPANAANWSLFFTAMPGGGSSVVIPNRHAFQITGTSANNLGLGSIFAHYQYQPRNNAYNAGTDFPIPSDLDFGLVSDPLITINMDWGAVADSVLFSVDFETAGTHVGPP